MNVPQPMPMSAPPPPPRKSGALKWILIGCGVLGFIGLIVCGGCVLWGISMGKSVLKIQEDVEALAKANPDVREAIGEIREFRQFDDKERDDASNEVIFKYKVKGTKGEGEVHARLRFTMTKFELKSAVFDTSDGRTIPLK